MTEATQARTIIIFVHGTGASARDLRDPHWWQPISPFSRRLRDALGGSICVAKPQRWNGLNSESSRRRAGAALMARLQHLDGSGVTYHLVGHSHGGSVIWKALVGSAVTGRQLRGLRSWVTVGTPFLGFSPDPTAWWRYIGLAASGMALTWAGSAAIEAWREQSDILGALREAGPWSELYALFTVALFGALALQTFSHLLPVGRHLSGLLRRLTVKAAEKRAAGWYGSVWLALWHERDEAIAGLRASLVDPYPLWPRWAAAAASRLQRVALGFHDQGFARAIDQFVWAVGMSRLQGADMPDSRMVEARHCPAALSPGWASLPPSIAATMTSTADSKAAITAALFRERLAAAGDYMGAEQVFSSFGSSVSWQELIHTSYFDQDSVVDLIAAHVASAQGGDVPAVANPDLSSWLRERAPSPELPQVKRANILAFPINRAIASMTAVFLLLTAALSSYSASIAPYTKRVLIDRIAESAGSPALASVANSDILGDILVRLIALGRVSDFRASLDRIFDKDSRTLAFSRLANVFGRNLPDTSDFLTPATLAGAEERMRAFGTVSRQDIANNARARPIEMFIVAGGNYPTYVAQTEILSGMIDAGQRADPELISQLVDNVNTQNVPLTAIDIALWEEEARIDVPDDNSKVRRIVEGRVFRDRHADSIALAAANLLAIGDTKNGERLLDAPFSVEERKLRYCPESAAHVRRAAALGSVQAVLKVAALCRSRTISNDYLYEAAFAAHTAGHLQVAGELFDMARNPMRDLKYSPRLWNAIMLAIDRDKADDALTLVAYWRDNVKPTPAMATRGRALELAKRLRAMAGKRPADRERLEAAAAAVIESAIASFQEVIDDPISDRGNSASELTRELATILMSVDRAADARRLAEKAAVVADTQTVSDKPDPLGVSTSSRTEERRKRAVASIETSRLHSTSGDVAAAERWLRAALPLIDGIWTDDTYEIGCAVFAAAIPVDRKLAQRALEMATGQAAREPDFSRRTIMFTNLALQAAVAGQFRNAVALVDRAGHPLLTLAIYSLVLDRILANDKPAIARHWGLADNTWRPVSADFLNVSSVPECHI